MLQADMIHFHSYKRRNCMNNKRKKSVRKINRQRRASLEALVKYLLVFAYENVQNSFL